MEWFVLVVGVVALTIGAAMMGKGMNTRGNPDKEGGGQPADQETGQPWQRRSPDRPLWNEFWSRQTYAGAFPSGLESWRWEPAGLHRPALPSTVTSDTTVLLKGPQVTVPVTLAYPWIIGPALPIPMPPQWLRSWSIATSQTGDLLLWPWQAGAEDLPDRFAILIPAPKLSRIRSNPQDPRVSLSSLVILDLRLGLPRRQIRVKQIVKQRTTEGDTSADTSADMPSSLPRAGTEPEEPGLQQLTQIIHDLRKWSGGVPILAGIPAGSRLAQDLGVLASVGFDGAVIFASPLAAGLPLPLSGGEVGLPLASGMAAARAAKESAGLTDWPIIAAGRFATPADCLKAVALGAAAVILDAALTWPELLSYRADDPQMQEQVQVQIDEAQARAATEFLAGFAQECESMLRILGCRRLGELSPRLLTDTSGRPGTSERQGSMPAAMAATVAVTPTAFTPPVPTAATPVFPTPQTSGAADGGWTSKREFVQPRLLAPRPPRRIRVLSQR